MTTDEHVKFDDKVQEYKANDYVPETPLEHKMAEALKVITSAEGRKKPKFAKVQLQFPKAADAFKEMKDTFNKYDADKGGTIDLEEITEALKQLGATSKPEEINDLFETADAGGNKSLSFQEFVVFLCVSSLLGHLSGMDDLDAAFRCAVDAFDVFDVKNQGVIVFSELQTALNDGVIATPDILLARMEEMDKDGNGYVIFPEFLIAFMDWVGVEDDDDEE